jgi:DNA-binding MarR family transcriptional regulator
MPTRTQAARTAATDAIVRDYASRGRECAYGNLRLMVRVVGALYEEALREVDLHAGQLPLLWAIAATEPVDLSSLSAVTHTDATTLSRTVEKLRKVRLVDVRAGVDRRRKEVRLTALGRERFAAAMPRWEDAQRKAAAIVPVVQLRGLARQVRHAAKGAS